MKGACIELWQAPNLMWYFHKRSRNGKVTSPSQGYSWKSSAVFAAKRDIPGLPIVIRPGSRIWQTDREKRAGGIL